MKTKNPSIPISPRLSAHPIRKAWVLLAILWLASSRADVLTDWNNAALDAIRAAKTPPPKASRSLAMLHVAIFDAVNGIHRKYESYLVPSAVPASASMEAAASAAGHIVLVALYPTSASAFDTLYASSLAT